MPDGRNSAAALPSEIRTSVHPRAKSALQESHQRCTVHMGIAIAASCGLQLQMPLPNGSSHRSSLCPGVEADAQTALGRRVTGLCCRACR